MLAAVSSPLRILFLGVPVGAEILRRAGHPPAVSCLAPLDLPGARRIRRRTGGLVLGNPDLGDPGIQRVIASARPDVLFSFFFPRLIPSALLDLPPRGAFGTHPSLLPRWRGPDPYFWALRAGDAETGVTLHRLEVTYDTGAIVDHRRLSISAEDNSWSLAKRLDRGALAMLAGAAHRLAAGESLVGEAQPTQGVSWAPRPDDEALAIDWRKPARDVLRLVRAAAPEPGATATFGSRWVEILRAAPWDDEAPAGLRPAEAWRTDRGWAVRCGTGAVLVQQARDEGGEAVDLDRLFTSVTTDPG